MYHKRLGVGKPLLLIHGLGSTWRTWEPILTGLAAQREVIAVDLPGFGQTPPLPGAVTIATLTDAITAFIEAHQLAGVDLMGSSVGARLTLELARRGVGGDVVALDPGGFWTPGQLKVFSVSIGASIRLIRALQPIIPMLTSNPVGRTALFAQFSAKPWALPQQLALRELRTFAEAPSFDPLLNALAYGPNQQGATADKTPGRVVIGWGRQDRVVFPSQATRALAAFPDAKLHWFDDCGHFPMWDQPEETIHLALESTA